jgi:hypothetical protein
MANEIVQRGIVSRLLRYAQKQQDGQPSTPAGLRTGPYGEQLVQPIIHNKMALAEEGAYYTNGMSAASSAVTYGVTTAYTSFATSLPIAVIQNNDNGQGVNIGLDFLRFQITTAPTAGVSAYCAVVLDQFRTPTANFTQLNTAGPYNTNGNVGATSISNLYIPATGTNMTLPAATASARNVVRAQPLRAQIPVALDEYVLQFGSVDGMAGGSMLTAAAAGASRIVAQLPPVIIPPQWFALVYLWFPSSSGFAAFNGLEEGHYER